MRKFKLDKLVRGGVFQNMLDLGQQPEHRILEGAELLGRLREKMEEEAAEHEQEGADVLKELADLQEVVDERARVLGYEPADVRVAQEARNKEAGDFAGHIFVSELVLQDDDEWVEYYASHPERFPEIKE